MNSIPDGLFYYCKECEKLIEITPKNFEEIKCPNDESHEKIIYGTERSVKNFFKIKDPKFDKERLEREKIAERADKL